MVIGVVIGKVCRKLQRVTIRRRRVSTEPGQCVYHFRVRLTFFNRLIRCVAVGRESTQVDDRKGLTGLKLLALLQVDALGVSVAIRLA